MNTTSENTYHDLMSGDRINFITKETKEIKYDFKVTSEIMNQFEKWKIGVIETTDTPPTELEMLEWFKKLDTLNSRGGLGPKIEVVEIKMVDINEERI